MERNKAVDISKGVGIMLVMLGHLAFPHWLQNLIYFFHMPFFIAISAYFYKDSSFKEVFVKGRRILISYFFYGMLFLSIHFLMGSQQTVVDFFSLILAKPIGIWHIHFFGIFWFIIVLFLLKLLVSVVKITPINTVFSFALFFIIYLLLSKLPFIINLPFALGQVFFLSVFYMAGISLRKVTAQNNIYIISTLAFMLLSAYALYHFNGMNTKIVNYHHLQVFNPLLALLLAFSGIVALYSGSLYVSKTPSYFTSLLSKLGEYSFAYMALHLFVFFILKRIVHVKGLWGQSLIFILSIIIIACFIYLIRRFFSKYKFISQILLLK